MGDRGEMFVKKLLSMLMRVEDGRGKMGGLTGPCRILLHELSTIPFEQSVNSSIIEVDHLSGWINLKRWVLLDQASDLNCHAKFDLEILTFVVGVSLYPRH